MKDGGTVHVSQHPLMAVALSQLRDVNCHPELFRTRLGAVTTLLLYEALADLTIREIPLTTPMGEGRGACLSQPICITFVLRAGFGMLHTALQLLPDAKVYPTGMYRNDETLKPVWYKNWLPDDCGPGTWVILDPMLATGGSAIATVVALKERGGKDIRFVAILAAEQGVDTFVDQHPDVHLFVAAIDPKLTDGSDGRPAGYIDDPGLGDAGDRQFGT